MVMEDGRSKGRGEGYVVVVGRGRGDAVAAEKRVVIGEKGSRHFFFWKNLREIKFKKNYYYFILFLEREKHAQILDSSGLKFKNLG